MTSWPVLRGHIMFFMSWAIQNEQKQKFRIFIRKNTGSLMDSLFNLENYASLLMRNDCMPNDISSNKCVTRFKNTNIIDIPTSITNKKKPGRWKRNTCLQITIKISVPVLIRQTIIIRTVSKINTHYKKAITLTLTVLL